jgi:peptide methionine sulfoxide reductase msrA/msrB
MKATAILGVLFALAVLGIVIAAPASKAKAPQAPSKKGSSTISKKGTATMVSVYVFNKEGKLVGPVESEKVVLSDKEWKARLTPEQFQVLRSKGTERPYCGTLLDNKKEGVYACVGCGLPLFSSDSKFNSGTGWPSFFQPIGKGNVAEQLDRSHGMIRTEINCARCDGHLGHVFEDGPLPTGLRFCLNSASLNFTESEKVAELADPAAEEISATDTIQADKNTTTTKQTSAKKQKSAKAVFAGGCFWCTEAAFEQLEGVSDVESGYAGGKKETANYHAVSSGRTGHAEAIRITYDPEKITYDQLLDVFFDAHDPTQLNRQGPDKGTQYRSAIFFADDEQKSTAQKKIDELAGKKAFPRPIVTTLEPLTEFYSAEDYHQDYARNNPLAPYIQFHSTPKACKIREKYSGIVKPEEASRAE